MTTRNRPPRFWLAILCAGFALTVLAEVLFYISLLLFLWRFLPAWLKAPSDWTSTPLELGLKILSLAVLPRLIALREHLAAQILTLCIRDERLRDKAILRLIKPGKK
ncbi:MAG: hypothetical protein LBU47_04230 [Christensenellaceae bacterium]|nr:hypothetical protein [Christensenellaceae bacterium]